MFKYIVNPVTNKIVNVFSEEGKLILSNYVTQYGGKKISCSLNPKGTGRCVFSKKWDRKNCKMNPSTSRCILSKKLSIDPSARKSPARKSPARKPPARKPPAKDYDDYLRERYDDYYSRWYGGSILNIIEKL